MPGASIVADQSTGAGAGSPSVARNDLWQNQQVDLSVATDGNINYVWEILDKPIGSSAVLANNNQSTTNFVPDLVGTYRIRLTTNGGGAGNVQTLVFRVRYDSVGALANRGWAYPALGEIDGESNYDANTRAWAQVFEYILEDIRTNAFNPGFTPGGDLDGNETTQTVIGLLGALITGTPTIDGQVITFQGTGWSVGDPDFDSNTLTCGDANMYGAVVIGQSLTITFQGITANNGTISGKKLVSTTQGADITGDVAINGNLTVTGTTVTFNSSVVDVADRVIHMNHAVLDGFTPIPVPSAITGFSVERGSTDGINYRDAAGMFWVEGSSKFKLAFNTAADDNTVGSLIGLITGALEPSSISSTGTIAGNALSSVTSVSSATLYSTDLNHTGPVGVVTADAADGRLRQSKGVVLKKTYLQLFDGEVVDDSGGWVRLGTFYWEPDDILIPAAPVVKFSAIGEVSNVLNTCEVQLWDVGGSVVIAGSTRSISSTTPAYQVSGALTMPGTARVLEVQMRSTNTLYTATVTSARLEIHPE